MAAFLDNCRFIPTAGGTTNWVYLSAVGGCQSPALAGAVDGRRYKFLAISSDVTQWEIAEGAYTASSGTFARTTILYNSAGTGSATGQSGAGSKIDFTTAPNVAIVGIKEDLISPDEDNGFTNAQKDQISRNIGTFRAIRRQVFTSSGTYTPDPNLIFATVECIGGGGSSGSVTNANIWLTSGGGGGGEYSFKLVTPIDIGASKAVTIGAGGAAPAVGSSGSAGGETSVGTLCIAKGGLGGTQSTAASSVGPGGSGGTGGTGDLRIPGGDGGGGFSSNSTSIQAFYTCFGGASRLSGNAVTLAGASIGTPGKIYGGGGSGSGTGDFTSRIGAAGAPGIVIITEYCSK